MSYLINSGIYSSNNEMENIPSTTLRSPDREMKDQD